MRGKTGAPVGCTMGMPDGATSSRLQAFTELKVKSAGSTVFRVRRWPWVEKYVTFYRLHVAYYILLAFLGALVLWSVPLTTSKRITFVNALYTCVSVLSTTGLQCLRSSELTSFHYSMLMVLMVFGSPISTSLFPLLIRVFYFRLCIKQCAPPTAERQDGRKSEERLTATHENSAEPVVLGIDEKRDGNPAEVMEVKGGAGADEVGDPNADVGATERVVCESEWNQSVFVDRERALRSVEYRALVALGQMVVSFFIMTSLIAFVYVISYFLMASSRQDVRSLKEKHINQAFYALFSTFSTFSNAGYPMTNDSMQRFRTSAPLLLLYSTAAALGNSLYGPFLRFLVWMQYLRAKTRRDDDKQAVYGYLLRHPRRCFAYLFPRCQTMWLLAAFVVLTVLQMFVMCLLEWESTMAGLSPMEKLVAAYYQSIGTRNAGGDALKVSALSPAVLFVSLATMYLSAYPSFLSVQAAAGNGYDELHIETLDGEVEDTSLRRWRRIFTKDTTFLFFAILALCLSESRSIKKDPLNFAIFNIIFEVVSFSGTWSVPGRLIIVVVMIFGHHRGLPNDIDTHIRLPTSQFSPHPTTIVCVSQPIIPHIGSSFNSNTQTIIDITNNKPPLQSWISATFSTSKLPQFIFQEEIQPKLLRSLTSPFPNPPPFTFE